MKDKQMAARPVLHMSGDGGSRGSGWGGGATQVQRRPVSRSLESPPPLRLCSRAVTRNSTRATSPLFARGHRNSTRATSPLLARGDPELNESHFASVRTRSPGTQREPLRLSSHAVTRNSTRAVRLCSRAVTRPLLTQPAPVPMPSPRPLTRHPHTCSGSVDLRCATMYVGCGRGGAWGGAWGGGDSTTA